MNETKFIDNVSLSIDGLNNKLDTAEERTSELEDRLEDITQSE